MGVGAEDDELLEESLRSDVTGLENILDITAGAAAGTTLAFASVHGSLPVYAAGALGFVLAPYVDVLCSGVRGAIRRFPLISLLGASSAVVGKHVARSFGGDELGGAAVGALAPVAISLMHYFPRQNVSKTNQVVWKFFRYASLAAALSLAGHFSGAIDYFSGERVAKSPVAQDLSYGSRSADGR